MTAAAFERAVAHRPTPSSSWVVLSNGVVMEVGGRRPYMPAPKVERVCRTCHAAFRARKGRSYCSGLCARRARHAARLQREAVESGVPS